MGIFQNRIVKNVSWIVGCRIVQSIINLIITMFSARYLGPANYGLLSYVMSVFAFVTPVAQLGMGSVLVEEIISKPDREGEVLGTSLTMCAISSILCVIGCTAFVSIANAGERDTLIVCVLYSFKLVFQVLEIIRYWYQAKLLSKYVSITSLVAYSIVALYKVSLLATGKSVHWFAISNAIDSFLIVVTLTFFYRKIGSQWLSVSFSLGRKMLARSKYYVISGLLVATFSQSDRIMIKMMVGNAENGIYATANSCAGMTGFVFSAIIDSFRPVILQSKKVSRKKYEDNFALLYSLIIILGLAQSVVLTVGAKVIVGLLYGDAFQKTASVLQILTWSTMFSQMGIIRNIWLLAEVKHTYLWIINLLGAIINILGNLALIPMLGACGAAISTVVTQFFTNCLLCFVLKPIRPISKLICKALDARFLIRYMFKNRNWGL